MNICIPVDSDKGLDSTVCAHFGSAPIFMIVDTETEKCKPIKNTNQHHAHGMCQPLAILAGEKMDAIVVGGIGAGALMKLQAANIEVYKTSQPTVKATIEALANGKLQTVTPGMACSHHH
jgi:predicted Fe-Mo cluster-binding NifX family protein